MEMLQKLGPTKVHWAFLLVISIIGDLMAALYRLLALALLIFLLAGLYACDHTDKAINDTVTLAKQGMKSLNEIAPSTDDATNAASEEFKKLSVFEYKIVKLDRNAGESGTKSLELLLNRLGAERWDCSPLSINELDLELICKRRQESFLRYIPRMFP